MRKYLIVSQNCISLRKAIKKKKKVDNEKFIKATLYAKDFEEEQNFRSDPHPPQHVLEKNIT